jgi:hypothetical protein
MICNLEIFVGAVLRLPHRLRYVLAWDPRCAARFRASSCRGRSVSCGAVPDTRVPTKAAAGGGHPAVCGNP